MPERIGSLPDLRVIYAKDFPLSNTVSEMLPRLRRAGLVITAVCGIGTLVVACSGGGDSPISESLPKGGSGEPKNVAVRAFQALIDGDESKYQSLLRPIEPSDDKYNRDFPSRLSNALQGCSLSDARLEVQVEDGKVLGPGFGRAFVYFREPCGNPGGLPFKACTAPLLVKKDSKWYLDGNSFHCSR